jgi:phage shock protein PspC (stress-responsive transcriptional regulator)
MNKTVNINLSGIIFHIEEDAYSKLHGYLSTIKGYFSESEGRDEIMSDIENRIAEMLSEKVSDKKQVVLMADVERVIEVMGKPEDFAGDSAHAQGTSGEQTNYRPNGKRRRVFRDPDHKILGGVCSGIANYFNVDPLWLRLALVITFFAFGSGFLLYLVLWIVIPEARTSAEKLEMRGEDVNFSNIGKKVEEEMNSFGKKAEKWGEEVRNSAASGKARDFIDNLIHLLGTVFGGMFRIIAKVFGFFFAILGLILLVGIISSLFGGTGLVHVDGESFSIREGFGMLFENPEQELLGSIAVILFLGVPLIMLVYGGIKMLLGIRTKNRFVGMGAGILWVVGLILTIVLVNKVAGNFSEEVTSKNIITLTQPGSGILYLKLKGETDSENTYEHRHMGRYMHVKIRHRDVISADSANLNFGYPELDIVKSETDSFDVVIYGEANGKDRKEALHLAKSILYDISQKDSLVEFASYFSVPKDEKWRGQQIHIEVRVPKGKMVYISKNMKSVLSDVHNETDTWDGDMVGRRWIMGAEELRCIDCDGLDSERGRKWKRHADIEMNTDESAASALPVAPVAPEKPQAPAVKKTPAAAAKVQDSKNDSINKH